MEVIHLKEEFLNTLNLDEDHERECKLAEGGLPESIWETYSSFANTDGGTIFLKKMTKNGMIQRIGIGPSTKYERR